jgi:hypothetical protein
MVADRIVLLNYQTRSRAMFGYGPGLPAQHCQLNSVESTFLAPLS